MKHKLCRSKFIKWIWLEDFVDTNHEKIQEDLIKGSEYILTAQDILENVDEMIPSELLLDYTGKERRVSPADCTLVYVQPKN